MCVVEHEYGMCKLAPFCMNAVCMYMVCYMCPICRGVCYNIDPGVYGYNECVRCLRLNCIPFSGGDSYQSVR